MAQKILWTLPAITEFSKGECRGLLNTSQGQQMSGWKGFGLEE